MGTAVIIRSKVNSYAHENILAYLDNRSLVKDPRNPNSTQKLRTFLYDSDPFHKGINFSDFPYIVCSPPSIEQSMVSADGKHKDIAWVQRIVVRSAKDGSANTRTGVGRTDIQDIGDDLFETFNSETVKAQMRSLNMYELMLEKTDSDVVSMNQKEIYEESYELRYMTRLQVSA